MSFESESESESEYSQFELKLPPTPRIHSSDSDDVTVGIIEDNNVIVDNELLKLPTRTVYPSDVVDFGANTSDTQPYQVIDVLTDEYINFVIVQLQNNNSDTFRYEEAKKIDIIYINEFMHLINIRKTKLYDCKLYNDIMLLELLRLEILNQQGSCYDSD
jgi:hypothetical protein